MVTHIDLLQQMTTVRRALVSRFSYFIHVTPAGNFGRIRADGLRPFSDSQPPTEVLAEVGDDARNILCLYPLGAKRQPVGTKEPPCISLAVAAEDLPHRLGLDWSYSWNIVRGRMQLYPNMPIDEFVVRIADEFGSIVSYDTIPRDKLRVFCRGNLPTNPLGWTPITTALQDHIVLHD